MSSLAIVNSLDNFILKNNLVAKENCLSPISKNILAKALDSEEDLSQLIQSILTQEEQDQRQKVRQFRDLTLCLSLLDRKIASLGQWDRAAKSILHHCCQSLTHESERLTAKHVPEWSSPLEELEMDAVMRLVNSQRTNHSEAASYLKTRPATSLSIKTAAHIHAEGYLKDTGLEGHDAIEILNYIHAYLSEHPAESEKEIPLRDLMDHSIAFNRRFDRLLKRGLSHEAAKYLYQSLKELPPGQSLLIKSGWKALPSGHAMYLKATREADGNFHLKLYDLSQALERRFMLTEREGLRAVPHFEKQHVSEASLLNPDALTSYTELMTILYKEGNEPTDYQIEDLLFGFWDNLEGQAVTPSDLKRTDFYPIQVVGNCTWASFVACLHDHFEEDFLIRMLYRIECDSLCALYQSHAANLSDPTEEGERVRMLLRKSAEQMIRRALWNYTKSYISLEELDSLRATLQELFKELDDADRKAAYLLETDKNLKAEELEWKVFSKAFPPLASDLSKTAAITSPPSSATPPKQIPFKFFNTAWTPAEIAGQLTYASSQVDRLFSELSSGGASSDSKNEVQRFPPEIELNLALALHHLFRSLPGPNDDFWNEVAAQDTMGIPLIMMSLAELTERQLFIHGHAPASQWKKQSQLYGVQALAVQHRLLQLSEKKLAKAISSSLLFDASFRKILKEHPSNNFYHPDDRKLQLEVASYIEQVEPPYKVGPQLFPIKTSDPFKTVQEEYKDAVKEYVNTLIKFEWNDLPPSSYAVRRDERLDQCLLAECSHVGLGGENSIASHGKDLDGDYLIKDYAALRRLYHTLYQAQFNIKINSYHWVKPEALFVKDRHNITHSVEIYQQLPLAREPDALTSPFEDYAPLIDLAHPNPMPFYTGIKEKYWAQLKWPKEHEKEILFLMSSEGVVPEQTKALQCLRVLSYYMQHSMYLKRSKDQALLQGILFEGSLLEELIKSNPQVADLLGAFFQKEIEQFQNLNDLKTVAFLIETARHVEQIARYTLENPITSFPNYRVIIKELLAHHHPNVGEKAALYAQLAASYATHPPSLLKTTPEEEKQHAVDFFTASLYLQMQALEETTISPITQTDLEEGLRVMGSRAGRLFSQDGRDEILHLLLENLTEQKWPPTSWKVLSDQKYQYGDYLIDLNTRSFMKKGLSRLMRQDQLLKGRAAEELKGLFKGRVYLANAIDEQTFQFEDERGILSEIRYHQDGNYTLLQQLQPGEWFQYLKGEDQVQFARELGIPVLFEEQTQWINPSKREILFLDKEQQHQYVLLYNRQLKVSQLHPVGSPDQTLLDLRQSANPQHEFKLFASIPNALLWGNGLDEPVKLELPHLKLTFKISPEPSGKGWRAECEQLPGYFLAANQRIKGFGNLSGSLVLENEENKRKLIVPRAKQSSKKGALTKSFSLPIQDIPSAKRSYFTYDIKGTASLSSTQREAVLYSAYLLMGSKRYAEAWQQLAKTESFTFPYSENELEILKWMSKLPEESKNHDPHAAAIALKAAVKWLKKSSHLKKEDLQFLVPYFKSYRFNQPELTKFALTSAEDEFMVSKLNEYQLLENESWSQLKGSEVLLALEESHPKQKPSHKTEEVLSITWFKQHFIAESPPSSPTSFRRNSISEMLDQETYVYLSEDEMPSEEKEFNESENVDLEEHEDLSDIQQIKMPALVSDSLSIRLLTRPGKLAPDFNKLYRLARDKDPVIPKLLAFAKRDSQSEAVLIELFEAIYRHPELFPSQLDYSPNDLNNLKTERQAEVFYNKVIDGYTSTLAHNTSSHATEPESVHQFTPELASVKVDLKQLRAFPSQQTQASAIKKPLPPILTAKQLHQNFAEVKSQAVQLSPEQLKQLSETLTEEDGVNSRPEESLTEDVSTYWEDPERKATWHQVPPEKLESLQVLLNVQLVEERKQLTVQREQLLDFANQLPKEMKDQILADSLIQGEINSRVTFSDLLRFALRRPMQSEMPNQKNSALIGQEKELKERIGALLERETRSQQISRALIHLGEAQKRQKELNEDQALLQDMTYNLSCQHAFKELTNQPAYQKEEHLDYLVFEFLTEMRLFAWQCGDLDDLFKAANSQEKGLILQKIMGSGKSKVYLPLMGLLLADGHSLPLLVVPQSQYGSILKDLDRLSNEVFGQAARTIEITREGEPSLDQILRFFLDVIDKRHYVVITDKSVQSLGLKFYDLWLAYLTDSERQPQLEEEIIKMREILKLLGERGKAILDEADLLLNCFFELNYTVGKEEVVNQEHCRIVADLYALLLESDLAAYLKPRSPEQKLPPLIQSDYEANLLPKLVDRLLATQLTENRTLGKALAGEAKVDAAKLKAYLLRKPEGDAYVASLKSETAKNVLAIIREELTSLLPHTLNKRCGEHFGYGVDPQEWSAVPYLANNTPSLRSKFGFLYSLLNFSVQTLLEKGVKESILTDYVHSLEQKAAEELAGDSGMRIEETAAYEAFANLCSDLHHKLPFLRLEKEDIAAIITYLNASPDRLLLFAKEHLFPMILRAPAKISSTPLDLVSLFGQVLGFTGTPWNRATFPTRLATRIEKGTDGKTVGLLWANSQGLAHIISQADAAETVKRIVQQQHTSKEPWHAFIDAGAVFKDCQNREVAEEFLKQLPSNIQGVVFYDKHNRQMVLQKNKRDAVPLEACTLSLKQLYTYYDQWHTVGSDVKQAKQAVAWTSIGKQTKIRDLLQAVWRLRELDREQKVRFILSEETAAFIRKELGLPEDSPIALPEILKFVKRNEGNDLKAHVLTASLQRIRHLAKRSVAAVLENPTGLFASFRSVSDDLAPLLSEALKDAPFDLFGKTEKELPKQLFFERAIQQAVDRVAKLAEKKGFEGLDLEALKQKMWEDIPLDLLPDTILAGDLSPSDQLVETEQVQEQEKLNEQAKESESQQEKEEDFIGQFAFLYDVLALPWNLAPEEMVKRSAYQLEDPKRLKEANEQEFDRAYSSWRLPTDSQLQKLLTRPTQEQAAASQDRSPPNTTSLGIEEESGYISPPLSFSRSRSNSISEMPLNLSAPSSRRHSMDLSQLSGSESFSDDETLEIVVNLEESDDPTFTNASFNRAHANEPRQPALTSLNRAPLFNLGEACAATITLEEYQDVFSFECSHNFIPIAFRYSPISNIVRSQPLDGEQLKLQNFLILEDRASGNIRGILIDQEETLTLIKRLAEVKELPENGREVDLYLYDVNLGIVASGSKAKKQIEGGGIKRVERLAVEAKFFRGEMIYSRKEEPILKQWVLEKGLDRMEELFKRYILKKGSASAAHYPQSKLAKLFAKWRTELEAKRS